MKRMFLLMYLWLSAILPVPAGEPTLRSTLKGHTRIVQTVAYSPNGKLVASGSTDNTIKLWEVATGKSVATIQGDYDVESVVFSPDGEILASGGWANRIRLWDVASGKNTVTVKTEATGFALLAFSADGRMLALANRFGKTIKLWELASSRYVATLRGHTDNIQSVAFSPDGKTLGSWGWDTVKLWDVARRKNIATWDVAMIKNAFPGRLLEHRSLCPWSMAFSPDGKTLALAMGWDKAIRLWDVASGRNIGSLSGDDYEVLCVAYSPDGRILASGYGVNQHYIKLWDVASGKAFAILKGHDHNVVSLAFSPYGEILASGSWDMTVRLWNVPKGVESEK